MTRPYRGESADEWLGVVGPEDRREPDAGPGWSVEAQEWMRAEYEMRKLAALSDEIGRRES